MAPRIRVGDVGHPFTVTWLTAAGAAKDLTGISVNQIQFKDPSGNQESKTASLVGAASAGVTRYTTVAGDTTLFDEAGVWYWRGHFEISTTEKKSTEWVREDVEA